MKRKLLVLFFFLSWTLQAEIFKLNINGPIDSITEEYVTQAFDRAVSNTRLSLIIIEIETPGGFDTSMRTIIKAILNANVPVVVYVTPKGARAASAGFFITIAADIAVMAPGTNMGAAHPVSVFGSSSGSKDKDKDSGQDQNDIMNDKVTNDAASYIKALAKSRQRNIDWAEKAVTESKSYTAEECLNNNLINFLAEDINDLVQKLDGMEIERINGKKITLTTKNERIVPIDMSNRQKFLRTITNPSLAYFLLILGFIGLYIEFTHPGVIIPGVLGAIFLILAFLAFQILPINYIGLLLILLSIGFFIVEIKIQGFGMFGIGGIISFVLGSIILIKAPVPEMRPAMSLIILLALLFAGLIFFLTTKVIRAMKNKVHTGQEGLIGEIGVARTVITPTGGRVFVHGEWWNAIADEEIPPGQKVIVEIIDNFVLKVKKGGG